MAAIYELGEDQFTAIIVRYPDRDAALTAWATFVSQALGMDATSGSPGGRRVALASGTWGGTRIKGRVGAFVLGAPTRNRAELLLVQTLIRAHD